MAFMVIRGVLLYLAVVHFSVYAETCGPTTKSMAGSNGIFYDLVHDSKFIGHEDVCAVQVKGANDTMFTFNSRGDVTVTLGYKTGPPVTVCGFRVLPTGSKATGVMADGTVVSSGVEWRFDGSGRLISGANNGCSYTFSPGGNEKNHCGMSIRCQSKVVMAWDGKVIKENWERTPESNPGDQMTVTAPGSNLSCRIRNSTLLNYKRVQPTEEYPLCSKTRTDKCTVKGSDGQAVFDELPYNKTPQTLMNNLISVCRADWTFLRGTTNNGVSGGDDPGASQ